MYHTNFSLTRFFKSKNSTGIFLCIYNTSLHSLSVTRFTFIMEILTLTILNGRWSFGWSPVPSVGGRLLGVCWYVFDW